MGGKRPPGWTLVELLIALFGVVLLLALLMPAADSARQTLLQVQCQDNLADFWSAFS